MAISVELGPGTRLDAPSMSRKSARDTQARRRTNSSSIIAICAAGPPNAIVPSRRKERAICLNCEEEAPLATETGLAVVSLGVIKLTSFTLEQFGEELAHFILR